LGFRAERGAGPPSEFSDSKIFLTNRRFIKIGASFKGNLHVKYRSIFFGARPKARSRIVKKTENMRRDIDVSIKQGFNMSS
jgi:hypothetical protein